MTSISSVQLYGAGVLSMPEQIAKKSRLHRTQKLFWSMFAAGSLIAGWVLFSIPLPPPQEKQELLLPPDPGPVMVFMRFVDSYDLFDRHCQELVLAKEAEVSVKSTQNSLDAEKEAVRAVGLLGVTDQSYHGAISSTRGVLLAEWNTIIKKIDRSIQQSGTAPATAVLAPHFQNVELAMCQAAIVLGLSDREVDRVVRDYLQSQLPAATAAQANPADNRGETSKPASAPMATRPGIDEGRLVKLSETLRKILKNGSQTSSSSAPSGRQE